MEYKRGYFVFNTYEDGSEEILGAFSNQVGSRIEAKSILNKNKNITKSEAKLKVYFVDNKGKVFISATENIRLGTPITNNELYDSADISVLDSMYDEFHLRNPKSNLIAEPKKVVEVLTGWFCNVEYHSQFSDVEVHGAFQTEKDANDYKKLIGSEFVHCIYERNYVDFENRIHILDSIHTKVFKNEKNETVMHEY